MSDISCPVCSVIAPLTLVSAVPAFVVMTTPHVSVEAILFQTPTVLVPRGGSSRRVIYVEVSAPILFYRPPTKSLRLSYFVSMDT